MVTTLPELKWLVDQIGTERIQSKSLLNGNEDPHYVDASPSFVLSLAKSHLVIFNGLELEIGWLPVAIQTSNNQKIQLGAQGYCDASIFVDKAEILKNYDRSMGDVHPAGNPHYTLSIQQMKKVAKKVLKCLVNISPSEAEVMQKNYQKLLLSLDETFKVLKAKINPLKNTNIMSYHREFVYLFQDFNFNYIGTLEKVPGILPSASQLLEASKLAQSKDVLLMLASRTNPKKYLDKFSEISKVPYLQLPLHMNSDFDSYLTFQEFLIDKIVKNAKSK